VANFQEPGVVSTEHSRYFGFLDFAVSHHSQFKLHPAKRMKICRLPKQEPLTTPPSP
jgi:hypothetical protein